MTAKRLDRKLGAIAVEYDVDQPMVARLDARANQLNYTGGAGLDRALLVDAMLCIQHFIRACKDNNPARIELALARAQGLATLMQVGDAKGKNNNEHPISK